MKQTPRGESKCFHSVPSNPYLLMKTPENEEMVSVKTILKDIISFINYLRKRTTEYDGCEYLLTENYSYNVRTEYK